MKKAKLFIYLAVSANLIILTSCQKDNEIVCTPVTWYQDSDGDGLGNPLVSLEACKTPEGYVSNGDDTDDTVHIQDLSAVDREFGGKIDLSALPNYAFQPVPSYISRVNGLNNPVTNQGATLGRVLFYDKNLSTDRTISCASCHQQALGFGDNALQSQGVAGVTGRHSMRLVNARFSLESRFFWDERANSLEDQVTMPIQDHVEMGFSGQNGDPGINELIERLEGMDYYRELFAFVYGDSSITEARMQNALAQFVRSIQSFDSKYDAGRNMVNNDAAPFPNFTPEENMGKNLFLSPPPNGAGCQGCHRSPEFDIAPDSQNNGIVGVAGEPGALDLNVTRSPTLRDLFNPSGQLNGPLMHDGSRPTIRSVIDHYNEIVIVPGNSNIDNRLLGGAPGQPPGTGQRLNLTEAEKAALEAFLRTLTGSAVYTDERWSDPFEG